MKLVDSCGWLEYLADSVNASNFAGAIEDIENLLVPTICLIEVFKKILKEKDENAALMVAAQMKRGNIVPLDEYLALTAAKYGYEYSIPMADSIIFASGLKYNAEILTQDSDLKDLPNVKYFQKK